MKSKLRLFFKEESGVAVIFLAISMVVLMGFTALAVDFGLVYYQRSQLQTALDSAALAAAQKLPDTAAARQTAIEYAKKNGVKVNSDDEIIVEFLDSDSIVRVTASQETNTSFAKIFNVDKITSVATAAAQTKDIKIAPQTFPDLLFNGDRTDLNLPAVYEIEGSVDSNGTFSTRPSSGKIYGELSGVMPGSYYDSKTVQVESVNFNAQHVPMPDFSSALKQYIPSYPSFALSDYFSYAQNILNGIRGNRSPIIIDQSSGSITGPVYISSTSSEYDPKVWEKLTVSNGLYVQGSAKLGGAVELTGDLFVTGNLTIGDGFKGNGTIIVGGDLIVRGDDPTSFNGDIYVGGNIYFYNGANININGNITCKNDISMSGIFNYCLNNNADSPNYLICGGNLSFKKINAGNVKVYCNETIKIQEGCIVTKGIFFAGNNFECSHSFAGSGYIFAENSVLFRGWASVEIKTSEIAVYAVNGDIEVALQNTEVQGIIYAPKGKIQLGGVLNFFGNVIGHRIQGGFQILKIHENPNGNPFDTSKTISRIVLVE